MKTQLLAILLSVSVGTASAAVPVTAPAPTKAEIAKAVGEAGTYQPGQSREAFRQMEEWLRHPSSSVHKHVEAGLVQLLSPGNSYEAQEFACTQLAIIGSKSALRALSNLLANDRTAGIACLALSTYPSGQADEVLRTALKTAGGTARIQIINTLGDRRDRKAVKLLASLANDADLSLAKAAVVALGKIGDQAAGKAILALPKDVDPTLRTVVTEATLRCAEARAGSGDSKAAIALYEGALAASQPTHLRRAALDALLRLDQAQAQQRILRVLHESDEAIKPVAIAHVRSLPAKNASEVFAAELPNLTPPEQVWMIDSLAQRGDAAASEAIGKSLGSPDVAVRRAAITALGRMGNAWCVDLFARALDRSKDAEERRTLESALIDLPGRTQTDRAIVAAMRRSSGNTRATLITALARREGPSANIILLAEASQADVPAAKAALRALGKTATAGNVTPLLERLTSARNAEVRAEAENAVAQAITRIESPGRRSAMVRDALGWAQGPESRLALLGLLPACGDDAALNALKAAAANPDPAIRDAAVRALADWPDASAWDALAAIYRQPATESARGLALRGLVRLVSEENAHPSAKLGEHYRLLLAGAHGDADLRLILGALGGAAMPGALKLALPQLDNPGVRAEAEVAVKKIAEAIKTRDPKAAQEALNRLQSK